MHIYLTGDKRILKQRSQDKIVTDTNLPRPLYDFSPVTHIKTALIRSVPFTTLPCEIHVIQYAFAAREGVDSYSHVFWHRSTNCDLRLHQTRLRKTTGLVVPGNPTNCQNRWRGDKIGSRRVDIRKYWVIYRCCDMQLSRLNPAAANIYGNAEESVSLHRVW
jgi:hypothetical protein